MLAMAPRPEPTAMLNHRGERIMPLPYRPKPVVVSSAKATKTRKLSAMQGGYEQYAHLAKRQRSDYNLEPELELEPSCFGTRRPEVVTPFDLHLQAVYEGAAEDGLQFFESHGYYDVSDANTVEMFRQNFGLGEGFWLGNGQLDEEEEEEELVLESLSPAVYPFGSQQQIVSSRNLLHRERTDSGRFTLLDDDGNEVDEHTLWEMEREDRLKAKSLALDDDELAELAHDQLSLLEAISVIRSEKTQLQQFFLHAFREEQARAVHVPGPVLRQAQRTELPPAMPPADLELPPYCGYVNLLKDTIPFLMRSWHKRWFYLDFQAGVVLMYKRSYWKSPRGVIDLRNVAHIEKMSQGDFRIEFHDTGADAPSMMLMRSKLPEEAELWVNLLRFAKQASRGAPRLTDTVMDNTKALMKKANKKNQVDILAQLLTNSANNARSSNLRAIAQASAVAASAVSNRRNSKHHRHQNALTA
ncbi:Zinc finger CCCH domain-containing protein 7 [Phytophthora cinnamomi]|uniref:Zinc finger CCCH domain-containing protein 7 n=1 Tax=Phytophthora cinnamomi TaxID=4785 RepID=UPI0035594356|nr:Zinc finger CCCH domain-containing protein 7 [Phytophthora cinnamomi]